MADQSGRDCGTDAVKSRSVLCIHHAEFRASCIVGVYTSPEETRNCVCSLDVCWAKELGDTGEIDTELWSGITCLGGCSCCDTLADEGGDSGKLLDWP